jgi:hypothetical protein
MMNIFLLAGGYGTGKTFLAKYLANKFQYSTYASLAMELRYELIGLLEPIGLGEKDFFSKPTPNYIRSFLHGLGDFRRVSDNAYWVKKLLDNVDEGVYNVFVDDARFCVDYEYLANVPEQYRVFIIFLGEDTTGYDLYELMEKADLVLNAKPDLDKTYKLFEDYYGTYINNPGSRISNAA